ncbi:probable proline--tRNA ligase, mitochondrial [Uloborus diversus]|uniref:probable proline--tRNA ligase, mitochondrial n=1 Tax=Uloborus diversus TaxID=327109 RepID=UPI00240971BF|nr:probable proline--tRNA ligase, mitochondrial [Uloborus diversus]
MVFNQVLKNSRHPKLMSQILRFREPVPKEKGSNASTSKSLKLMLNEGFIKPVSPGLLSLMPLAVRSLEKLICLVDAFMANVNGQKVLFPSLVQRSLMKASGRWDNNSNLFKLTDRSQNAYCLGATHEEIATSLLSHLNISYKILPLRLYQISSKFRDELNPKLGLLRGREFIMKDMYTYDANEENSEKTYVEICDAYEKLFNSLEIEFVKVVGSSGDIGGHSSHEFHVPSHIGEDEILVCPKCKTGYNIEVLSSDKNPKCISCGLEFDRKNAIEIGHAFLLGTTYSKPFDANYNSSNHSYELLQMGCYGLGLSRILAASIESLSTVDNIRWPLPLAPFQLCIIVPKKGSKEEPVTPFAVHLAECLNKIDWLNNNIVIDERTNLTIGKRLQDASAIGIPFVIVVAGSALEEVPKVEVVDVYNSQTMFLTHKEILYYFRSKSLLNFQF